jgi:signal peptidase II
VIVLDQVTKIWAVSSLSGQPSLRVLGDFLLFTLVYNEGGAMGTRLGPSVSYLVMAFVVLPFLLYYIYHNRNDLMYSLPLSFIAGGAVGNLIDRIRLGKVVDFVDADFFDIDLLGFHMERFWVFNVADAAISCAITFLLIVLLLSHKQEKPVDFSPESPPDSPL